MSFYINVYSDPAKQIPDQDPDFSTDDIQDDQTIMFRMAGAEDVSMTGADFKNMLKWMIKQGRGS